MGELVLFPIRTEEDRVRALKIIDDLLMEDPAEGGEREALLEAFITLVEKYESKSWEALPRDPVRTVRFVMEQNGLSQKDLAPYFGSAPRVSEFLSGKIPLTLKTIRRLHHKFNIPLEMLMLEDGHLKPSKGEYLMDRQAWKVKTLSDWKLVVDKYAQGREQPSWARYQDIFNILSVIASKTSNHTFLPRSGGLDLKGVVRAKEVGCIELEMDNGANIIKPRRLTLNIFKDDNERDWAYFHLELDKLRYAVNPPSAGFNYEEVLELRDLKYVERSFHDQGEYEGEPLPTSSRIVTRWFGDTMAIFCKSSTYNSRGGSIDAYSAKHNEGSPADFRNFIHEYVKATR